MNKQTCKENLEKQILQHKRFLKMNFEKLHPFQKSVIERTIQALEKEIEND